MRQRKKVLAIVAKKDVKSKLNVTVFVKLYWATFQIHVKLPNPLKSYHLTEIHPIGHNVTQLANISPTQLLGHPISYKVNHLTLKLHNFCEVYKLAKQSPNHL